ncbi:PD-(D/E)XK nuclease family protein, partial [Verrucomicrobiota bacterium]
GRIDRIDENTQDGRIRIIDYKTSDKAWSPASEHLALRRDNTPEYNDVIVLKQLKKGEKMKHMRWQDLQLPLYAMIYTQGTDFPDKLELAYFGLPKTTSETSVMQWPDFDGDKMASAVKCMDGVLEQIGQAAFWPPSERTKYDDPFASLFLYEPEKAFKGKAVR